MKPIIQTRNLTKMYSIEQNRIFAVRDVSLDIYEGEFVCIVGTSGSGKSTLLYLLAGIERATKGQILVKQKRLDVMGENELVRFRRDNVGFVFQSFNLMPYFTSLDNIALPLMMRGTSGFARRRAAAKMLKNVGLPDHAQNRPTQLSGGQQQRVSIARALITQPDILFADEPTGNLDSHTGEEILQLLLNETKKRGKTLVMVTHDVEKAKYADRIFHISDGEIVSITGQAPPEQPLEEAEAL